MVTNEQLCMCVYSGQILHFKQTTDFITTDHFLWEGELQLSGPFVIITVAFTSRTALMEVSMTFYHPETFA